jgi:hypothetical protein
MDGGFFALPPVLSNAAEDRLGAEMSLHRYAARRDDNEPEIRARFARHGWHTEQVSGAGMPDLIAWPPEHGHPLTWPRQSALLVDVKTPTGGFKPAQVKKWTALASKGIPVYVARTEAEVDAIVGGTAEPWGHKETRGKALATVTADAGKRLRAVRKPGKGENRAPRPAYEAPRKPSGMGMHAHEQEHPGPIKRAANAARDAATRAAAESIAQAGDGRVLRTVPRGSRTSHMATKAVEPSNAAEHRALLAAQEAEATFAPGARLQPVKSGEGCGNCEGISPETCMFRSNH